MPLIYLLNPSGSRNLWLLYAACVLLVYSLYPSCMLFHIICILYRFSYIVYTRSMYLLYVYIYFLYVSKVIFMWMIHVKTINMVFIHFVLKYIIY
jgi:hypothetical protein